MGIAKNKKKDIGLEFIQRIHFHRRQGSYAVCNALRGLYGDKWTEAFFDELHATEEGSTEFYDFKNQNIDVSTVISENYDSEILRQFCNYLYDYKDYIKGDILDVGCESGYMTAFLAMYFPEARITAIDRSENAVNVAKERLNKFGITNVQFKTTDVKDLKEQYDTVISMRTLMENMAISVIEFDIFQGEEFSYQFLRNKEETQQYADTILNVLKDGGHLISIERLKVSPLEYGWLSALNASNCAYLQSTLRHINCKEVTMIGHFTAFVAQKGKRIDDALIHRFVIDDLRNVNDEDSCWVSKTFCKGWPAIVYFLEHKGECIVDNFIIEQSDNISCVGRAAAYVDRDDQNKLLCFVIDNSFPNASTRILDINMKDQILSEIEEWTKEQERIGFKRSSMWPISS